MNKQPTIESVVFVIDDDASVRESLKSLFESVGLHVELFGSADAFLQSQRPDVACCLVLDVRLPGLSGLEFQSELAKTGTDVPIIFMTGHGDIPMTVQAMKAGAVEFLTKPCRDQELLDAVRLAIEGHRARRKEEKHIAILRGQFAVADCPREGGCRLRHRRTLEQADRRRAGYQRSHGKDAPRQHHAKNASTVLG